MSDLTATLALGLAFSMGMIFALTLWGEHDRRSASLLRAEIERLRRERSLAITSEDYVVARIGDLSEGTLTEGHARDLARWIREWL